MKRVFLVLALVAFSLGACTQDSVMEQPVEIQASDTEGEGWCDECENGTRTCYDSDGEVDRIERC